MNNLLSRLSIVALLACNASMMAQGSEEPAPVRCGHHVVERLPTQISASNLTSCGAGVQINLPGISYTTPPGFCALLIVVTPEHYVPRAQENSNTNVIQSGTVSVRAFRYECVASTFLWLITISSTCVDRGSFEIDRIPNYIQVPCRV